MQRLIFNLPDGSSVAHEITLPDVTVGSGAENAIVVQHESVADQHIQIMLDVSGYVISDLAGNGTTWINDYPIEPGTPYQLEDGTCVRMGEIEAVYCVEQPETEDENPSEEGEPEPEEKPLALPGSCQRPAHPPGVFVPKKARVNLWMVSAMGLAALVLLGGLFLALQASGFLGEVR